MTQTVSPSREEDKSSLRGHLSCLLVVPECKKEREKERKTHSGLREATEKTIYELISPYSHMILAVVLIYFNM